jgi:HAD superfamily hydrolase (TIGR01490 family)
MSKFAVFDIDGTLIRWQLYHAITDRLVRLGFIEAGEFEELRQARMNWKRRERGATFKTYELAMIRSYEKALRTLSTDQLNEAVESVFDEYKDQVYVYTRDLIKKLSHEGYLLFAISGSQTEIVAKIADHYGFTAYVGTIYERKGERFTGKKQFQAGSKDQVLRKFIADYKLDLTGSYGVGDSQSDIAMLEIVENPIAFNPESHLFEHSKENGWKIVVERKDMVYELEEGQNGSYILA